MEVRPPTLERTDLILIADAWERIDAAADRGETCEPYVWKMWDPYRDWVEVRVDPETCEVWLDGLLSYYREGDALREVGSLRRILVY